MDYQTILAFPDAAEFCAHGCLQTAAVATPQDAEALEHAATAPTSWAEITLIVMPQEEPPLGSAITPSRSVPVVIST